MARIALHLLGGPTLFAPTGIPIAGGPSQRHRIALLAELAVASPNSVSRDRLIGTLWPDRDTPAARRLLNVAISVLRSALGADVIQSAGDDLRLAADAIDVDIHQFERALDEGRLEEAVANCRGVFLEGFFLDDAAEFERWVEAQRFRLARRYANALTVLAERTTRAGDSIAAVGWWRALGHSEPTNPTVVLQLMDALAALGDVTGALAAEESHAAFMRGEVGVEPDARVTARGDELRTALIAVRRDHALPRVTPVSTPPAIPSPQRRFGWSRIVMIGGVAALVLAGTIGWRMTHRGAGPRDHDLVTVVMPVAATADVPADLAESVTDLLSLNVGQADGVTTASASQVIAQQNRTPGASPVEIVRAMHAYAGVSGRIVSEGGVRHAIFTVVDSGGRLLGSASVDLPRSLDSLQEAVDAASVQLLRVLWGRRWFVPEPRVASISTTSMPAFRAFLDGERAFRHSDWDSAATAFDRAGQLDSTFALAYLRLSEALEWHASRGPDAAKIAVEHAARFGSRLPQREAALLAYRLLTADRDYGAVASAVAFARQYPGDVDAEFSQADIAFHAALLIHISPDSLQRLWDRAIAADPVSLRPFEHLTGLALYADDHARYRQQLDARLARGLDSLATVERLDTLMMWGPLARARDTLLAMGRQVAAGALPAEALSDPVSFVVARCVEGREDCHGADAALIQQLRQLIRAHPDARKFAGRWGRTLTLGRGRLVEIDSLAPGLPPRVTVAEATTTAILGYADSAWLDLIALESGKPPSEDWRGRFQRAELALARRDTITARRLLAAAADTLRHDNSNAARGLAPFSDAFDQAAKGWITIIAGDTATGINTMNAALRSAGYISAAQRTSSNLGLELAMTMAAYRPTRVAGVNTLGMHLSDVGVFWPMIRLRYAQGLDALGRRDEAADQYRRFANVWTHADVPLRHLSDDATKRAAALAGPG